MEWVMAYYGLWPMVAISTFASEDLDNPTYYTTFERFLLFVCVHSWLDTVTLISRLHVSPTDPECHLIFQVSS